MRWEENKWKVTVAAGEEDDLDFVLHGLVPLCEQWREALDEHKQSLSLRCVRLHINMRWGLRGGYLAGAAPVGGEVEEGVLLAREPLGERHLAAAARDHVSQRKQVGVRMRGRERLCARAVGDGNGAPA